MRKILIPVLLISLAFVFYGCGGHGVDVVATTTSISATTSSSTTTTLASVAAPTFALASGSYEAASLSITIETTTASADVYYTLDGSNPSASSTKYTGAFSLESSVVVKAIAVKNGLQNSSVSTANYDIYWWSPVGGGVSGGSTNIYDMAIDSAGNLYVGGLFDYAGGQFVKNIAKWNVASQTWEAMKNGAIVGTSDYVFSITIDHSNNVYIGGNFVAAGGVTVNYVARWDGSSWAALGPGTAYPVLSLLLDNSNPQILYAGGNNILQKCSNLYTASPSWSSLGTPVNSVYTMALDNSSYLYAGGNFSSMSGVGTTAYIARWNFSQSTWESIGQTNNVVNSIALDNSPSPNVLCGGIFTIFQGPIYAHYLAYYQSGTGLWFPLGVGTDYSVSKLVYDPKSDQIYVGGGFSGSADSLFKFNCIGIFNRTTGTWKALGTGTNDHVNAIVLDGAGNVYIGGQFTTAGGVTVNGIARWGKK